MGSKKTKKTKKENEIKRTYSFKYKGYNSDAINSVNDTYAQILKHNRHIHSVDSEKEINRAKINLSDSQLYDIQTHLRTAPLSERPYLANMYAKMFKFGHNNDNRKNYIKKY